MIANILFINDYLENWNKDDTVGQREIFKKLVDPTYTDMSNIHTDYIKSFLEFQVEYNHNPESEKIKYLIYLKKNELETLRIKTIELSKLITKKEGLPENVKSFFNSILEYFNSSMGVMEIEKGFPSNTSYGRLLKSIPVNKLKIDEKSIF